jgi:hypothetical protein
MARDSGPAEQEWFCWNLVFFLPDATSVARILAVKVPVLVWLAIALLSASTVSAQSQAEASTRPPMPGHGLKMPAIVWAAGVAADQITTYRFSSQYRDLLHERNPLIQGLDRHPVLLVAAGSAIDAATGWAVYHFLGRHPRIARIAFYSAAAYRTHLAIYNVQMMREAGQVRTTVSGRAAASP